MAIIDFDTRNVPVNATVNSTEQAVLDEIKRDASATYDAIALAIGKNKSATWVVS